MAAMELVAPAAGVPLGWGSVGFFEARQPAGLLYQLYAAGHESVTSPAYRWDGLERQDGPLYLFQYTLSGQGELATGDRRIKLDPGSLMLLPIPGRHCYCLPRDASHWEFLYVLVRQDHLGALWQASQPALGPVAGFPAGHPVVQSLQDLVAAVLAPESRNVWQRSALVYGLFMNLLACGDQTLADLPLQPGIARVRDALRHDCAGLLSLDAMASLAGMSKYHFLRSFRAQLGRTPGEYLAAIRLDRALSLLQSGNLNLDAIARDCGYASASYFIKVFRRHTGLTPGEFRARSSRQPGITWRS